MVKNKYTGDALNILWKTKGRTFRKLMGGGRAEYKKNIRAMEN